ncbi:hypothetical protein IH733_18095, partial [Escherichia coli]|nr:hypothetical protein [Escherichia coli]
SLFPQFTKFGIKDENEALKAMDTLNLLGKEGAYELKDFAEKATRKTCNHRCVTITQHIKATRGGFRCGLDQPHCLLMVTGELRHICAVLSCFSGKISRKIYQYFRA